MSSTIKEDTRATLALRSAVRALERISRSVRGNEQHPSPDVAEFYRGYNGGLSHCQGIADQALAEIRCEDRTDVYTSLVDACRLALTRLDDGSEVSSIIAKHVRAAIAKAGAA